MKKLLHKLWRAWRKFNAWEDCEGCGSEMSMHFVKDWVYHPEEPPMFYHFECTVCNHISSMQHSILMDEAAKKFGYDDFPSYAAEKFKDTKA